MSSSSAVSIFYVVYLEKENKELQDTLDHMRFFAERKWRSAHITVRGPYKRRLASYIDRKNKDIMIRGVEVVADGVDSFFETGQNTVFVRCSAADPLRGVWRKSDYSSFNPHITIYNGPSRVFAAKLLSRLSRMRIHFRFSAAELTELTSYRGAEQEIGYEWFNEALVEAVIGKRLSADDVVAMPEGERLECVCSFARRLSLVGSDGDG